MSFLIVANPCTVGVTAESLRRFRGNVGAVSERRLSGRVHLEDYLVALIRSAGVQLVVQRRLSHQGQGVRFLLGHARLSGWHQRRAPGMPASPMKGILRGGEGLQEHRTGLRIQAPMDDDHAVLVLVDLNRSRRMLAPGLREIRIAIALTPAAYDTFSLRGGDGPSNGEEASLVLRGGDPGQRTHLGIGQLASLERLGQVRQGPERSGDAHPLPRSAKIQPHAPGQPVRAGAEARAPSAPIIELADKSQQPTEGPIEPGAKRRYLVSDALELIGMSSTSEV
jgi:hypothetical protein